MKTGAFRVGTLQTLKIWYCCSLIKGDLSHFFGGQKYWFISNGIRAPILELQVSQYNCEDQYHTAEKRMGGCTW